MIIRRVGVLSLAKISGVLYAVFGFIIGIFFSLAGLITSSFASSMGRDSGMFGALFGVGAIILLPIFYGVLGFVTSAIAAWLYNLIAGWVGGLEIELEDDRPAPAQPSQQPMV